MSDASYQVLARKWRPRTFSEMVGQEHVLRALINALDHDRLHHAYLFSGTRGVGKTSIARILAKCLNCEQGVSSVPCDQCSACVEINEGRFVDLIEVDAASRTKVEDTRELLDNVQYAPSVGRFKVYLIDEVHMLSNSSFNALLKTLEEPPEHVKFLLATTDPQKLPVTVLSRCLQFNLKNMAPERIVEHLSDILQKESISAEPQALWHIAKAAEGSMRDALGLTDQAVSFGNGQLKAEDVNDMLGSIDQTLTLSLIEALKEGDAQALMALVARASEQVIDYQTALAELLSTLHRIAVAQALPESVDQTQNDAEQITHLASAITSEQLQLFYQIALVGRKDLSISPDIRAGFEMVLLRMLAFKIHSGRDVPIPPEAHLAKKPEAPEAWGDKPYDSQQIQEPPNTVKTEPVESSPQEAVYNALAETNSLSANSDKEPSMVAPASTEAHSQRDGSDSSYQTPKPAESVVKTTEQPKIADGLDDATLEPDKRPAIILLSDLSPEKWFDLYQAVSVGGLLQNTFANSVLDRVEKQTLYLLLEKDLSALYDDSHQQRLASVLSDYFNEPVQVSITLGKLQRPSPSVIIQEQRQKRQQQAQQSIEDSSVVKALQSLFDAEIVAESIQVIDK